MEETTQRIIIVGGGFGGLETAFSLGELLGASAQIMLADRTGRHAFIPSIHEIIAGKATARDISVPLDTVLPAMVRFVKDEVLSIDHASRKVTLKNEVIGFDFLVLATGAENNFFGVEGAETFAYRFRSPQDAEKIRTHLLGLLEDRSTSLRIIIAGGGTEGVEVAGELVDAVRDSGRSGDIIIEIIHSSERLLPGFPPKAQEMATDYLTSIGVKILTGEKIVRVSAGSVTTESGKKEAVSMLIWTGGIRPPSLIRDLHLTKDAKGWLEVNDHLHSPDDDRIFALGDVAGIRSRSEALPIPRLAYHALDQALVVSENIRNHIHGRSLVSYSPRQRPQLISIGKDMGIFVRKEDVRQGQWVVMLKKAVETRHLMSCLSRPVYSSVVRRFPGAGILHRLRREFPF